MARKDRAAVRRAVHTRIRKKVRGSAARPRLAIFRSLNHIYAQVIDDDSGRTLASASTTEKDLRGGTGGNVEAARRVGRAIAERLAGQGITSVVFDRGGFRYHGRIRALAEAAREAGLNPGEAPAGEGEGEGASEEAAA
jgi:large subunit ribosomal protein L18